MKIEIRNVANGVVLRIEPQQPGDEAEEIVYQERDDDEVEAFADCLRFVLEQYGPSTSRYSAKRIRVVVEPGDRYETPAGDAQH